MKKIVLFTQNLDIGGVQKSVSTLANFLTKFYKVYIVLAEDNKKIRYRLDFGVEVLMIKTKKFDLQKKFIALKIFNYRVKEFDKILKIIKPSLVFSYEDYNNLIVQKSVKPVFSLAGNGDMGADPSLGAYQDATGFSLYYTIYKKRIRFIFSAQSLYQEMESISVI